ncbi:hypothetical protein J6590_028655 [Homalodisca vitripennis]|nr:hypothetical protein J6590_028655 [Homalodisca vitripennis]
MEEVVPTPNLTHSEYPVTPEAANSLNIEFQMVVLGSLSGTLDCLPFLTSVWCDTNRMLPEGIKHFNDTNNLTRCWAIYLTKEALRLRPLLVQLHWQ